MSIASDTVSSCLTSATWQRDVAKHATSLASLYGSPSIGNWISILMSVRQVIVVRTCWVVVAASIPIGSSGRKTTGSEGSAFSLFFAACLSKSCERGSATVL